MASPGPAPPRPAGEGGRGRAGAGGDPRRPGEESRSLRPGARGRPLLRGIGPITFIAPVGLVRPLTRIHVGLLGPCYKTGREEYRLFARREGQHKDRVGEGEAREARRPPRKEEARLDRGLGPHPRSRTAPEERPSGEQDEGTGGSPDGRAGKRPTPPDESSKEGPNAPPVPTRTRASDAHHPNASRRPTAGGRSPAGAGQAAGGAPHSRLLRHEASGTGSRNTPATVSRQADELNPPSSIFESPPV